MSLHMLPNMDVSWLACREACDHSRRGSCNRMRAAGDQGFALRAASRAPGSAGPIAQPEQALLQGQRK